jgi:hypothetical protein
LTKHQAHLPRLAPHLYKVLGQKFVKVKNVKVHAQLLYECIKESNDNFLNGYDSEVNKILQTKKNHLEIARLLRTWTLSATNDQSLLDNRLINWTDLLLKSQGKREIESIEAALDLNTLEDWLSVKEKVKGQQKGFIGRIFG